MPEAHLRLGQRGIGDFENDAADVFIGEEIFAGELEIVEGALGVEEERIAAPTGEEAIVAGYGDAGFAAGGDWRVLKD